MKAIVLIATAFAASIATAMPAANTTGIIDPPRVSNETAAASTFEDGIVRAPIHLTGGGDMRPTIDPIETAMKMKSHTPYEEDDDIEELDPMSPDTDDIISSFIETHPEDVVLPPFYGNPNAELLQNIGGCESTGCALYVEINLGARPQYGTAYFNGVKQYSFKVSGAKPGKMTRDWNGHPGGIFEKGYHDSSKYPSKNGGWHGLGNMPYAMFYSGNFAIHGTPSIGMLGTPASHGCVRMPPEIAKNINAFAQRVGHSGTWFYIHH